MLVQSQCLTLQFDGQRTISTKKYGAGVTQTLEQKTARVSGPALHSS